MSGTHYPKCEVCYYFNFHSCASFGNKVATHNIANVFQSGDDCEDSGTSRKEEVGDECGLGPLMSFAKAHATSETVRSFFCIPSIGWCDKQGILKLVVALLSSAG